LFRLLNKTANRNVLFPKFQDICAAAKRRKSPTLDKIRVACFGRGKGIGFMLKARNDDFLHILNPSYATY